VDGVASNGCEYQCPIWPPVAELCNDIDEDCDGVVNNGNPGGGATCSDNCPGGVCQGECTPGTTQCLGNALVCTGGVGPQLEQCDGKDNDCDGQTDEGFDKQTDVHNCGACGHDCSVANAYASCVGGACQVGECIYGYANLDGDMDNGCEYHCPQIPLGAEVCDGIDNDCDGKIDGADTGVGGLVGIGQACGTDTGECSKGTTACVAGAIVCQGGVQPAAELCDGLDNNCNGQIDESFLQKGASCTLGSGPCVTSGHYVCNDDHTGLDCDAPAPDASQATDETCNGLDDDCDGQVDEQTDNAANAPIKCSGATCKGWKPSMIKVGASLWVYAFEASRPDSSGAGAGTSNTMACSKFGTLPWTSVNESQAAAACAAVHDSAGNPMRLCTETEWQAICKDNVYSDSLNPQWAYAGTAAAPATYKQNLCNDSATSVGAPWTTGGGLATQPAYSATNAGPYCASEWTLSPDRGYVWDMTGNVAEWTSTSVTSAGKTYYRVKGGSFLSLKEASTCEFSFVLDIATYANFDVGFRCCSTAAP